MSRATIILLVVLAISFIDTSADKIECTRPHEHYECGSACQTRCDNLGQPCPIINIRCNDACYCDKGFARKGDDNSPCVPIRKCSYA
ncbi:inducible metalloproteinase inhibitor protein-like [Harpegnathos saltator]|uniref:inducible metalloproteinase inhibitor protein-like n=1 Tax=Harpegnathos saltator TaxID=610380 RepID=UPI00058D081C|nr:inducible metalloproteinase inhibitor protein-like [Harpegnathos saltator]